MKRAILNALILGSILAACTNDPDNTLDFGTTTTTITTATETTAAETTASSTTTVASATTTPPSPVTTTSTTPPPPPTNAPTTTIDVESQIRADFDATIAVRLACGQDPATCDFAAFAIPGSPVDLYTRDLMTGRLTEGRRTIEGMGSYEYSMRTTSIDGSVATVVVCIFDSVIVFDIADPANPDDDVVVNDAQDSTTSLIELRQLDGRWLWFDNETVNSTPGVNSCGE